MSEHTDRLPTITDAILDQWEASAESDLAATEPWSAHPLAVIAVVQLARAGLALTDPEYAERLKSADAFVAGLAAGANLPDIARDRLSRDLTKLPDRVVVGANGAYWRDYGDTYSMCPTSEDNDPVEPVAIYVRQEADATAWDRGFAAGRSTGEPSR